MDNKSHTYKNLLDDGYTTINADGSKSYTHKNVLDDGYTTINADGSKSYTHKNVLDDGYTTFNAGGSKSYTHKNVLDDGYTTFNADGSKSYTHKNVLDDGYTTFHSAPTAAPAVMRAEKKEHPPEKKPVQQRAKEYVYNAYPDDEKMLPFAPRHSTCAKETAESYALYAATQLLKACPSDFVTLTVEETVERAKLSGLFGLRREKEQIRAKLPENRGILLRNVCENHIGINSSVENEAHREKVYLTCDGRICYERSVETDYYDGRFREEKNFAYGALTDRAKVRYGDATFNLIAALDRMLSEKKIQLSFDAWIASGADTANKPDPRVLKGAQASLAAERAAAVKAATKPDRSQMMNPYLPVIVLLAIAVFPAIHLEQSQNKALYYIFYVCGLVAQFALERDSTFSYSSIGIILISGIELVVFVGLMLLLNLKTPWICAALMLAILVLAICSLSFEKHRNKVSK